jgi:CRP/FNR family transcriptional regulator, cyclic AMP receptor protein
MAFFDAAYAASERPVRLIDADPDLFEGLNGSTPHRAVQDLTVAVLRVPAGRWRVPPDAGDERLGLLVLDGLLARSVGISRQRRAELIGPGDLIRPWDPGDDELASVRSDIAWEVLQPARLAELDAAFVRSACRLPQVLSELVVRTVRRSQRIALQLAIADVRRVEERLLVLFGHLGDRWGRVTRDGIHVPVRLTHELIAQLIGAQRPTVTTGLGELQRQGRLVKRPDRTWLMPASGARR